jgi:hypothetical protein
MYLNPSNDYIYSFTKKILLKNIVLEHFYISTNNNIINIQTTKIQYEIFI